MPQLVADENLGDLERDRDDLILDVDATGCLARVQRGGGFSELRHETGESHREIFGARPSLGDPVGVARVVAVFVSGAVSVADRALDELGRHDERAGDASRHLPEVGRCDHGDVAQHTRPSYGP